MVTTYAVPTQIQHASINQGRVFYLPGHINYLSGTDVSDALLWWLTHTVAGASDIGSDGYIGKSGAAANSKNIILFQPNETYYVEYGFAIGLRTADSAVTDSTGTIILWPKVPEFAVKNLIFDLNGSTLRQADNTFWGSPTTSIMGDITSGGSVINNAVAIHSAGTVGTLSATSTTLTDGGRKYANNILTEYTVRITAGTGAGQSRKIIANTKTTMTVNTPWTIIPDATSQYQVEGFIEPAFKPGTTPPSPNTLPWIDFAATVQAGSPVLRNVYPVVDPTWVGRHCRSAKAILDYNSYIESVDVANNTITLSGGKSIVSQNIAKFTLPSYVGRACSGSLAAINFQADNHVIGHFAGIPVMDDWLVNITAAADSDWVDFAVESSVFNGTTTLDVIDTATNSITCSTSAISTTEQALFTIPDLYVTFRADTIINSDTLQNVKLVSNAYWKGRKIRATSGVPFSTTYSYILEVDTANNKIRMDQTIHGTPSAPDTFNFLMPATTLASSGSKIGSVTPTSVTYSVGHTIIDSTGATLIVTYPQIEPRRRYGTQLVTVNSPGSTAANPVAASCLTKDIEIKNGHLQMGNDNTDDAVQAGVEPWYAISLRACKNVLIQNIQSKNAWSDSVNTGPSGDRYDSQVDYMADSVTIDGCTFDGSGRHALCIQGSIDFLVKNSTIKNTVHWIIDDESFTPARVVGTTLQDNTIQTDGLGFMSWGQAFTPADSPIQINHATVNNGSTVANIISGTSAFITNQVGCLVSGAGVQPWTYVKRWNSYTQIELSKPVTSAITNGSLVLYDAAVTRDWNFIRNTLTAGFFGMNVSKQGQPGNVDFSGNTTAGSNQITNVVLLSRPDGATYTGADLVNQKLTGPTGVFAYGSPALTATSWNSGTNTLTVNKNALVTSTHSTPRTVTGVGTTAASPNITAPSSSFSSGDVGAIVVPIAPATGFSNNTRIKTYTSSSGVILNSNVSKAQSNISITVGASNIFSAQARKVPWSGFRFIDNTNTGAGRYGGAVSGITSGTSVPMIGLAQSYDDVIVTGNTCGAILSSAGNPIHYMIGYRIPNGGFDHGIPPGATAWTYSDNYWPNAVDNQVTPTGTVSIALAVNANPGSSSGPQTFTATLTTSNGGQMNGSIAFRKATNPHDPTPTLMNFAPIVNNVAVFTKPIPLTVGTYYISAYWSGDTNYSAATSSSMTYVVGSPPPPTPTTATLTITPSTIFNTGTTTFTAVVSPSVATGYVDFFDDATDNLIGSGTVTDGLATYTLITPSTGTYSFYAIYQGDPTYAASTSEPQSLVVLDPPPPPPPPVTVWTIDRVRKD